MKKNKPAKEIYLQRLKCNCVAQKHELINNCLSCGKVVCAQEGEGPCLYCGTVVTRPDGQFIVNEESLFPAIGKEELNKISQERSKAVIHKNTLLERDKSTNLVQNIYDESIDYYDVSENQWLDEESRQNAIDKLLAKDRFVEAEKLKQRIVFDPMANKFVPVEFNYDEESFKQEGKNFMFDKEKEEYSKKMQKAKENWDSRLFNNDKVKDIVTELRSELPKMQTKPAQKAEARNKVTELILEE